MFAVTFEDWVISKFGKRGIRKAADFLGYPKRTVYAWVVLYRFPSTKSQEVIRLKSTGKVDFTQWRTDYLAADLKRRAAK